MNVFYFTSDLFVSVAATSIVSLMENNKTMPNIHFYIVDDAIHEYNKYKLTSLIESYNRKVTYIQAPDPKVMFNYPFKNRYQMGYSYSRMCIGRLLPDNVDRVLCLDSDTLILEDLSNLWKMEFKNNILAGVSDCINLYSFKRQFGLSENDIYCNAGVFLIDLKKWRNEKIENKITNIIKYKKGRVFFFEQTLMNYVCKGKIYRLSPEYNFYTLFYAFKYENLIRWRQPTAFYSKKEVNKAKKRPIIIHFTRNFYMLSRPWIKDCDHPMVSKYLEYKSKTPWHNLDENNKSKMQKLKYRIWHRIPQKNLANVACILYNSIRPRLWWKNE